MRSETVKGFNDYTGSEALKRKKIKDIILGQFGLYGFEPAETPIIEYEEFVRGGISENEKEQDEAVRDVFKLEDRGKRKLALRYEFTFQLKRLAKNKKLPYKRYQFGYVFRDEPIKEGRTRQFIQCDADIIGSSVKDEAECLAVAKKIFGELKIPIKIYVNNRKLINEILVDEKIDEKNREAVIREIDKLDKLEKKNVERNLEKYNAKKILKIFSKPEKYFEKYNYYKEIVELRKACKNYGVDVEFRPYLARGLSYYNGTVFEVWSEKLGVAVAGGGSYLVDRTQATGISLGLEPIFLISEVDVEDVGTEFMVLSIGQDMVATKLAEELRDARKSTVLILDKGISKALDYANSVGVGKVVFVGAEEIKKKKFKVKNMQTGKEEFVGKKDILK